MLSKIQTLRKSLDGMISGRYIADLKLLSDQLRDIEDTICPSCGNPDLHYVNDDTKYCDECGWNNDN